MTENQAEKHDQLARRADAPGKGRSNEEMRREPTVARLANRYHAQIRPY